MDDRVGYILKRVQTLLRNGMDQALESRGLTTPQYAALAALETEPGISNADLARRSFVTPQTMFRIVENLENLGLLTREAHPTRGRVMQTTLTAKGRKLVASCHDGVRGVEARMLEALSTREQQVLRGLLARCAQALEQAE